MRRVLLFLLLLIGKGAASDELSSADKLRVVYSNQFAWTKEGLPLITVRVVEGRETVTLSDADGLGIRVLPDGDGGAEIQGGHSFTVRVRQSQPAHIRWYVTGGSRPPGDAQLPVLMKTWRERGFAPRTFEVGALFAVKGEVLDSRRLLVGIAPSDDETKARAQARALSQQYGEECGVHPELVERPRGWVEATDDHGTVIRNEGILWFAPATSGTLQVQEVEREAGGRESRRYFGKLYVTVDKSGKLAVVNAVSEDRLLSGLVPAEMNASAPPEALKAQAVAARNQLLAKLGTRHLTDPYRLCASQHCQVYAGAGREDPRATRAVTATRGELLTRETGGLVDTVYSANCGGHSEDNDRAWGGHADPLLRGALDADTATQAHLSRFAHIDDKNVELWIKETAPPARLPFCARPKEARINYRWTQEIDPLQVAARAGTGALREIEAVERGVSGRVVHLRLVGEQSTKEIHGELEIRRALLGLKSALFVLQLSRTSDGHIAQIVAHGGGHGHGIGMCQVGAVGMAECGANYRDILQHYYRGAQLRRMY